MTVRRVVSVDTHCLLLYEIVVDKASDSTKVLRCHKYQLHTTNGTFRRKKHFNMFTSKSKKSIAISLVNSRTVMDQFSGLSMSCCMIATTKKSLKHDVTLIWSSPLSKDTEHCSVQCKFADITNVHITDGPGIVYIHDNKLYMTYRECENTVLTLHHKELETEHLTLPQNTPSGTTPDEVLHYCSCEDYSILVINLRPQQIYMSDDTDIFAERFTLTIIRVIVNGDGLNYTGLEFSAFIPDIYASLCNQVKILTHESVSYHGRTRHLSKVIVTTSGRQMLYCVNGEVLHCIQMNIDRVQHILPLYDKCAKIASVLVQGHDEAAIVEMRKFKVTRRLPDVSGYYVAIADMLNNGDDQLLLISHAEVEESRKQWKQFSMYDVHGNVVTTLGPQNDVSDTDTSSDLLPSIKALQDQTQNTLQRICDNLAQLNVKKNLLHKTVENIQQTTGKHQSVPGMVLLTSGADANNNETQHPDKPQESTAQSTPSGPSKPSTQMTAATSPLQGCDVWYRIHQSKLILGVTLTNDTCSSLFHCAVYPVSNQLMNSTCTLLGGNSGNTHHQDCTSDGDTYDTPSAPCRVKHIPPRCSAYAVIVTDMVEFNECTKLNIHLNCVWKSHMKQQGFTHQSLRRKVTIQAKALYSVASFVNLQNLVSPFTPSYMSLLSVQSSLSIFLQSESVNISRFIIHKSHNCYSVSDWLAFVGEYNKVLGCVLGDCPPFVMTRVFVDEPREPFCVKMTVFYSSDSEVKALLHGLYEQLPDKVYIRLQNARDAINTAMAALKVEIQTRRRSLRNSHLRSEPEVNDVDMSSVEDKENVFKIREAFQTTCQQVQSQSAPEYTMENCDGLKLATDRTVETMKYVCMAQTASLTNTP